MTEVTPITTPISVRMLRSLCAHKLDVAIATASVKCIDEVRGIGEGTLIIRGGQDDVSSAQNLRGPQLVAAFCDFDPATPMFFADRCDSIGVNAELGSIVI